MTRCRAFLVGHWGVLCCEARGALAAVGPSPIRDAAPQPGGPQSPEEPTLIENQTQAPPVPPRRYLFRTEGGTRRPLSLLEYECDERKWTSLGGTRRHFPPRERFEAWPELLAAYDAAAEAWSAAEAVDNARLATAARARGALARHRESVIAHTADPKTKIIADETDALKSQETALRLEWGRLKVAAALADNAFLEAVRAVGAPVFDAFNAAATAARDSLSVHLAAAQKAVSAAAPELAYATWAASATLGAMPNSPYPVALSVNVTGLGLPETIADEYGAVEDWRADQASGRSFVNRWDNETKTFKQAELHPRRDAWGG